MQSSQTTWVCVSTPRPQVVCVVAVMVDVVEVVVAVAVAAFTIWVSANFFMIFLLALLFCVPPTNCHSRRAHTYVHAHTHHTHTQAHAHLATPQVMLHNFFSAAVTPPSSFFVPSPSRFALLAHVIYWNTFIFLWCEQQQQQQQKLILLLSASLLYLLLFPQIRPLYSASLLLTLPVWFYWIFICKFSRRLWAHLL